MLVTFRSNAYENITYFGDVAKRLLRLMGHSGTIPGAIQAQDLPNALAQLEESLSRNKDKTSQTEDEECDVSLSTRAIPLIHLLRASVKAQSDVLWDA